MKSLLNHTNAGRPFDAIIIGAGPGGLQAAIYLRRYNRDVLLIDRGGGRTTLAPSIVNYLGLPETSGRGLIDTGFRQLRDLGVPVIEDTVISVTLQTIFTVKTASTSFQTSFIVAASGARENMPGIKNMQHFFGTDIYTCVDCDGHHTTGKKLVIIGNSPSSVRLTLGMKHMYTDDITLLMTPDIELPDGYDDVLAEEKITVINESALSFTGDNHLSGIQLSNGSLLKCDKVMLSLGHTLNDSYLSAIDLKRDHDNFKIIVNNAGESSMPGLYVTGALRHGHAQAIIAAGHGATAAIDINTRLLDILHFQRSSESLFH